MLASNPLFLSKVNLERSKFVELLARAKVNSFVYTSKHFFERVVERNIDHIDVLRMATPVIHDYRATTYNKRSYCVLWKTIKLAACIDVGVESGKRKIILKTVYERDNDELYDEVIKL